MTYAQAGEDEMILALAAEMPGIPHTFVDIGAGDGERWSNTRLLLEQGWRGEWYDADEKNIAAARLIMPQGCFCWRVTCEDFPLHRAQDFGVLSIDVDGNDYWLWKYAHEVAGWRPWIVCIESQIQAGDPPRDPWSDKYVMPYDPEYVWDNVSQNCGASPAALIALGLELGYQYVGKPEDRHSPNLLFRRMA